MAERVFSNFATSKLASGIGQTDASLALTASTGALFPAITGSGLTAQAFSVVLTDGTNTEVMTCTARSGDTLTVTRGAPAYAFAAGTEVLHVCAAADLANFLQKGVFRTVTTEPDGVLSAAFFGEEVLNTTTREWWKNTSYDDPTEWRVTGPRGTVQASLAPQEAIDAGAQWRINGGAWINSGNYTDPMATGGAVVEFKDVAGYTTPASVAVGILAYTTVRVTAAYTAV